jgi:hypothetical protein
VWIAFGRNASVERNIALLARRMGAPGDPDRAIEMVRERRCLIVLDDVWRVLPFADATGDNMLRDIPYG